MTYKPISDYGVIGDMHSAALVTTGGSIDWLCFPRFDSPSVFAAILDDQRGGRFAIQPVGEYRSTQAYSPDTNILVSTFHTDSGQATLTDFMPLAEDVTISEHEVIRLARCDAGEVTLECLFQPRLNYARDGTRLTVAPRGVVATTDGAKLSLASPLPLQLEDGAARATFPLRSGETAAFILRWDEETPRPVADYDIPCKMGNTEAYWRLKTSDWRYRGRWSDLVKRSVLALHQLLYAPSGAICAAVTTSLPGQIGGPRNWDYRFCWLRDAAFTLDVFHRMGHTDDTSPFLSWLSHFSSTFPDNLHTLYGIGYETDVEERVLDYLEGYRGSRPVRVGNAANKQLQLDDYGELLLALASYYRAGGYIDDRFWRLAETLVEGAVANWHLPDHGIWEVRTERRHFVYSKLMCWVAVYRGIRLAQALGRPVDLARWRQAREAIRSDILANGFNPKVGAFVQAYGSDTPDASLLFMPMAGFLPASDPRMLATIDLIRRELSVDGLVRRYLPEKTDDGIGTDEGTFTMCTFWLIGCLILLGRLDEAQRLFENAITFSNHVGLFSEMVDPKTGEFLGNYPQAFTHIALIHTARNLDRALRQAELGRVAVR
jgi:GH15 family glucan-1,4-alpha-glucosidase